MSDQEQQLTETVVSSENLSTSSKDENQSTESTEIPKENESNPSEQRSTPRVTMPQDIRYSTEQNDREKLMAKYNNYQISDTNACNVRFLIDNRQKKSLLGRTEEENPNLHSLAKTFSVNMFSGYQQPTKHSYKIFGTEANVRQCLMEVMNRIFKRANRSTRRDRTEDNNPPAAINPESTTLEETAVPTENEKSTPDPTSIFVTTINPDSSITEEKKLITPSTPNTNEDKTEQEQLKFVPLERKPQHTFIMLISPQGQEVLKKNWSLFGGSLQQRLDVIVTNPVKLPKFGDKQIHHELSITGESIDNLANASLQTSAFINDALGVPIQPYKYEEESASNDNYNSQHQKRTFVNRNRNGIFEQVILIRNNCIGRIIGSRGSTMKRIQAKCHLREMIVSRQANENGYVECTLTAYQGRNLAFAIDTIRNILRNEDQSAVLVTEPKQVDAQTQDSPHLHELAPLSHTESSSSASFELPPGGLHFMTNNLNQYPQPSYNFQNTPSFDFTHQATAASRKTDKRRGDLNDLNKTPTESQNPPYENRSSSTYSPKHKSKRSCPETKEIDCTTDEGFWIQKQYYHALDETSKELFDSLIDKLDKIRIATEENAARKQQRLVGRNRPNKSRVYNASSSHLKEDNNNNRHEKDSTNKSTSIESSIKVDQSTDEKENQQETSAVTVNEN